jgi:hypothetical protein
MLRPVWVFFAHIKVFEVVLENLIKKNKQKKKKKNPNKG